MRVRPRKGLSYAAVAGSQKGLIFLLLKKSYSGLLDEPEVKHKKDMIAAWRAFDRAATSKPETIGRCVFVTLLGTNIIGFGSYDPRQWPEVGIIGHNCILPEFRGRGWGRAQLREILERLKERGFKKAKASTGDHPFFRAAQKVYLSCGFKETGRSQKAGAGFAEIEYELPL
jgi:GNAT superfamily N-acetyltransferase